LNDRGASFAVDAAKAALTPDLVLSASVFGLWKSTTDDEPLSPYMNHPFASYGYAAGLSLRFSLDFHLKLPRLARARADREATIWGTIAWKNAMASEVASAYETLIEAQKRTTILDKAQKSAHSWLTAVAQNFAVGTAEARDFNDALIAFFEAHARYL